MKNIFFDIIIEDVKKYKTATILLIAFCTIAAGAYGYLKAGSAGNISESEQVEIDAYQEKLAAYEASIDDVKKAVDAQADTVDSLQEYIDNSIYMKINPESIKYVTVQYGITYDEGTNASNVNNALLTYIKDGGLRESIGVSQEIEPKYLGEVLNCSISANVLNITLMHYDFDLAGKIMKSVKENVEAKVKDLASAQGGFQIEEMGTSSFEKSEVSVINTQNASYNNLRSYLSTKADLENKLNTVTNTRDKFVADNRPSALDKHTVSSKRNAVKFLVVGFFGGFALLFAIEIFRFVFGTEIRNADGLKELGIPVISVYKANGLNPEADRIMMDMELLIKEKQLSGVHIQEISPMNATGEAAKTVKESAGKSSIRVTEGKGCFENAEDLKSAIQAGLCILIAARGRCTKEDIKNVADVCARFGIQFPGCILV